jgi:Flp pilus assembly protein TadG
MSRLRHRRSRGQGLVEFALVLPIFAIMLFGIIDLGRYVATANALGNSAREAARVASVGLRPSPQCDGLTRSACATSVAKSNSWFVPESGITVTVSCERSSNGGGTTPVANPDLCRTNDLLTVHAQSTFNLVTPLIAQFVGSLTISGDSKVLVNQ